MSNSLQLHGLQPARLLCPWNSPGKNTGLGSHSFLQGIFLTQGLSQGSNPSLPHCRQILYYLSQQRSPDLRKTQRNDRQVHFGPGCMQTPHSSSWQLGTTSWQPVPRHWERHSRSSSVLWVPASLDMIINPWTLCIQSDLFSEPSRKGGPGLAPGLEACSLPDPQWLGPCSAPEACKADCISGLLFALSVQSRLSQLKEKTVQWVQNVSIRSF